MQKISINTLQDLESFAENLASQVNPPAVFLLIGELGAGKTTFVQYFAKACGVNMPIRSPSFTIHSEYDGEGGKKIHHLDLYRLEKLHELKELKIANALTEHSYVFIEWADKFEDKLKQMFNQAPHYLINFIVGENSREVTFEKL